MTDRCRSPDPLSPARRRRMPRGIVPSLAALAIAATLGACGGGGGAGPVLDWRGPPPATLPALPLQRPRDGGNAPILYIGSSLHIGADVAPPAGALHPSATHGPVTVSHGTAADGIGAQQVADYLEHDAAHSALYHQGLTPAIEPGPLTVRIARGTTEALRDEAVRAVQLVNAALPRDWQMQVSDTPGIPGAAPPSDSDLLIRFLPREEWPDIYANVSENAVGLGGCGCSHLRTDNGWRIRTRAGIVIVDHTRSIGADCQETLVHEIIHALGRYHHPDPALFPDTIMRTEDPETGQTTGSEGVPGHILHPLDREALLAWFGPLRDGSAIGSLAEDFGPWSDTSTHLLGEFSAGAQDVSFGVALRNGLAQPWATGPAPLTDLADNTAVSGSASWAGRLLGFTPEAQPVAGEAALTVMLDTLDGDLDFTALEYWTPGQAPGAAGSGTIWSDGDLGYDIEVRGNTFVRSGGDEGIVTGAFLGTAHQAMGGTLQRDDLSAAFGGSR